MGASWVGPGRGGLGLETGLHYQEVIWHVQRVVVRGRVEIWREEQLRRVIKGAVTGERGETGDTLGETLGRHCGRHWGRDWGDIGATLGRDRETEASVTHCGDA